MEKTLGKPFPFFSFKPYLLVSSRHASPTLQGGGCKIGGCSCRRILKFTLLKMYMHLISKFHFKYNATQYLLMQDFSMFKRSSAMNFLMLLATK